MRLVTALSLGLISFSSLVPVATSNASAVDKTSAASPDVTSSTSSIQSAPRVLRVLRVSRDSDSRSSEEGLGRDTAIMLNDRQAIVVVPAKLPAKGERAMVVALHGGLGNAYQAYRNFGLDEAARKYGFIVVYMSGTAAGHFGTSKLLAWNAGGGCCGLPFDNKVDDAAYIAGAIKRLSDLYGVAPQRIYGIGHSNGGMMTQRLMCETNLYAASISVAGPLMLDVASCLPAKQKRILDIHGAKDQNVPIEGGKGTKGVSGVTFTSEASTAAIYKKSGAQFTLLTLSNADHKLDNIRDALKSSQKADLSEVMAKFFGLIPASKKSAP